MKFKNLLKLVLVILYSSEGRSEWVLVTESESHDLLQECCTKGKLRARSSLVDGESCLHPVPEPMTESCRLVEQNCCRQYFRSKEKCHVGVNDAINTPHACDTVSHKITRMCCTSCREGRLSNHSSALECSRPVLSGHTNTTEMLAGDAFMECCQLDRCERDNPCQHHCYDRTGLPKVECSCNPGYQLMADGKSCTLQGGENIQARLAEGSHELQNYTRMAREAPPTQAKAAPTNILVIHSQTNEVLQCSPGHVKLWEGYSLFSKDLDSTGTCLRKFSVLPFQPFTSYKLRIYKSYLRLSSYWLTTELPARVSPVEGEEIMSYVSRCTVCEVSTNVIAVHSQSKNVPSCPSGWDKLWVGYSFVAYNHQGPGEAPAGPGSCLRHFIKFPVIVCWGDPGKCNHPHSDDPYYMSYWLGVIGVDSEDPHSSVSRCSVCIKK